MNLVGLGMRPLPHPLHHLHGLAAGSTVFWSSSLANLGRISWAPQAVSDAWGDLVSRLQPSYTTCSLRGA